MFKDYLVSLNLTDYSMASLVIFFVFFCGLLGLVFNRRRVSTYQQIAVLPLHDEEQ